MGNKLRNDIVLLLAGIEPEKARLLLLRAALKMTRFSLKMRTACRLILISGARPVDAAQKLGLSRQNVSRSLTRLKPKLAAVREAYDQGAK